jgi:hypothetical protein
MAHIDTVQIRGFGSEVKHANISDTVGVGEKNEMSDVRLIQALFKLVGYDKFRARQYFRLDFGDLPEPTGEFDKKTIDAIWAFQRINRHRLLKIDGKIHPANYKNRVIKSIAGRVMGITFLNLWAQDGALFNHSTDVISALKIVAPQLVLNQAAP